MTKSRSAETFKKLESVLKKIEEKKGIQVLKHTATVYELAGSGTYTVTSEKTGRTQEKKDPYFAGIKKLKGQVTLYFMPIYMEPKLEKGLSEKLMSKRSGKSCFHFDSPEEVTPELKKLLNAGLQLYREKGFL